MSNEKPRIGKAARLWWLLAILSIVTALPAQQIRPARGTGNSVQGKESRPRLVLLIVVDQFRYDYLNKFGDLFGTRGLGRLIRDGALWTEVNFDQVPTFTAPGHATFLTGAWPSQTGIIANDWYERETGRRVKSVTDDDTIKLGGKPGETGYSPRRLLCPSVGDALRTASSDQSKVIGISAKDRSAVLPAGRRGNAAYWFGTDNGNMVSSTYYFSREPEWVDHFNSLHLADKLFGARWERLLPVAEYLKRAGKDDVPWENLDKSSNDTNFFPHVVTGGAARPERSFYKAIDYTPFSNDLLISFAEAAIVNEKLGEDASPDLLTISFSANDYVGHRFGPDSHEVMDMTVRVDRQIGRLLDFVDARIGLRNTVVVFTSDHGASPIPEEAALMHLPGARYEKADLGQRIENGLRAKYARPDRPANDYIQGFTNKGRTEAGVINANFYLNRAALLRDGIDLAECERVVGELSLGMPGVARYFTRTQLQNKLISAGDPIARRVLNGFNLQRSGDVVIVFEPYQILFDLPDDPTDPRSSATHGSPYSYDTHVPLIIMGRDFARGTYPESATPADIAPTLSSLLGLQPPGCSVGRILSEALRK